jgi:hypothetical protein
MPRITNAAAQAFIPGLRDNFFGGGPIKLRLYGNKVDIDRGTISNALLGVINLAPVGGNLAWIDAVYTNPSPGVWRWTWPVRTFQFSEPTSVVGYVAQTVVNGVAFGERLFFPSKRYPVGSSIDLTLVIQLTDSAPPCP